MPISEVAKLAGVSSSTVSRVINNHPRSRPKPSPASAMPCNSLATPHPSRPGPKPSFRSPPARPTSPFLCSATSRNRATPAFEELLRGVSMAASQNDLNLIFTHVPDPEHLPSRVLGKQIDGLLLHGLAPGEEAKERLKKNPDRLAHGQSPAARVGRSGRGQIPSPSANSPRSISSRGTIARWRS